MGQPDEAEQPSHVDRAPDEGWARYLERFHHERPGITEAVFEHARDPDGATAYDWLVDALPARPGRVVDIACGNAPLQPRLTTADSYLGIDTSIPELARARAQGRGPVARADARHMPMPDSSVDTVVSSMGLMLITPLTDALREIARILTAGGTLAALCLRDGRSASGTSRRYSHWPPPSTAPVPCPSTCRRDERERKRNEPT